MGEIVTNAAGIVLLRSGDRQYGESGAYQIKDNSSAPEEVQSITGLTPAEGATVVCDSWNGSAWISNDLTLLPGVTIIGRMKNLDVTGAVWVTRA